MIRKPNLRARILALLRNIGRPISGSEIAAHVGCSVNAVKVHIHHLRKELPPDETIFCDGWRSGYRYVRRSGAAA